MLNLKVRRRSRGLYISCLQLLIILSPVRVISGPIYSFCRRPNVTTTYRANLHSLLSTLLENSFQGKGFFYNSTTPSGLGSGDQVYALYLCRGDLGIDTCNQCVSTAIRELPNICNKTKTGIAWYDACFLRYSSVHPDYEYESLFSTTCNPLDVNVTQMDKFNQTRGRIMEEIIIQASNGGGKKFAVQEDNYSSIGKIFGLAQCIPDLSNDACEICLREAMSHIPSSSCDKKQGGRVLLPSCILQFENFHFYNVQSPPPAFSPPPLISSHLSTKRKRRRSVMVIALVSIISLLSIVMLFVAAYFFLRRRSKKKKGNNLIAHETDGKEILTDESLQYNLSQIQAATNNFCIEQKIGEGGFGSVYKGILPNGQEIAVKRLSGTSGQVAKEFKNEIALVAKLQHRNLVRLLGFCFEGEERILIYEYVPNKSLDNVLFGNNYCNDTEKQLLDWSRRRKIIAGIARGLLYIHEDSRLRVIHRDVKASNVLLDEDMEPKIADFGLARIFGVGQSKGNTSRIAGTYGYMAPEYLRDGQFSVKTDVFSFGVLILEIIIDKTCSRFYQSTDEYLLSYVWRNWMNGTPLAILDPALGDSYARDEVIQCTHVGLLCVQEDIKLRPNMASVVLMLNSHAVVVLPTPRQPAFLLSSETQNKPASVDDAPITEAHPR